MTFMNPALIISILNTLLSLVLAYFLMRTINHYNSLVKDTKTKDLISSLNQLIKNTRQNHQENEELNKKLDSFINKSKLHFQKIGFIRFNPFSHTGGDQSFALCLLDENDDGIVISSLHSRENTRVYAKKLASGESPDQILSKEEKAVIKQAAS